MGTTENEKKHVEGNEITTMDQVMATMDAAKASGKHAVIERGNIVDGTVIKISNDHVFVNVGYKSDSGIPIQEFHDLGEDPKIGSVVTVMITKPQDLEDNITISRKRAAQKISWDKIMNDQNTGHSIKAKVVRMLKNNRYEVMYEGISCVVPASQLTNRRDNLKPEEYLEKTFEFKVVEINKVKRFLKLSRRALMEEIANVKLDEIFGKHHEGDTIDGMVKSLTEYGAFVDIGGIDGLLHITDMSYGHVSNPADVVSIGQKITCKILKLDRNTKKISLGLKQLSPNPWDIAAEKYKIGTVCEGVVKNLAEYGAFLTLEPGIDGLIHVSDISWTQRGKVSDMVKVGEKIKVKVIEFNLADKRIKLGIKQLTEDPWAKIASTYPENTLATGKVKAINDSGVIVELEPNVEGFMHISDLSWSKKVNHPSELVKIGQSVEVKILKMDMATRRIKVGKKQTTPDPWTLVAGKYTIGEVFEGKITNLTKFGAFVELEPGIEGLIHISDLSWTKNIGHANEILKSGEKVKVKILEINTEEKKIALGYKQLLSDPWDGIDGKYKVGDITEGLITHFAKFGAFIELEPGVEGLLHTSDICWNKKYNDPAEVLKAGEKIKIRILNVDKEGKKVSLGLKQLTLDPLMAYKEKMDNSEQVEGKVKSIQEYGAFIELEDGIEGLIHISQLSDERVDRVENVVKVGETLKVKIIDVNLGERKIKLSMRTKTEAEAPVAKVTLNQINQQGADDFKNSAMADAFKNAGLKK